MNNLYARSTPEEIQASKKFIARFIPKEDLCLVFDSMNNIDNIMHDCLSRFGNNEVAIRRLRDIGEKGTEVVQTLIKGGDSFEYIKAITRIEESMFDLRYDLSRS